MSSHMTRMLDALVGTQYASAAHLAMDLRLLADRIEATAGPEAGDAALVRIAAAAFDGHDRTMTARDVCLVMKRRAEEDLPVSKEIANA